MISVQLWKEGETVLNQNLKVQKWQRFTLKTELVEGL